jgi:hypothetical protein
MRFFTKEAKLIEAAIATGSLDQDLKNLRKTIDQRMRKFYDRSDENLVDKFTLGSKWRFREDIQLRFLPQYLKGAICEVVENNPPAQTPWGRSWYRPKLQVLELKRKARGGFGSAAKFNVGSLVTWYYGAELIPYNSAEDEAELNAKIHKIREKHLGGS